SVDWAGRFTPGRLLADTVSRQLVESRARVLGRIDPGSIMLEEAVVTAQTQIPGSKNLNKGGGADQVILQEVFEDTPKKTLFDLIHEHVDKFGMRYVDGKGQYIPTVPPRSRYCKPWSGIRGGDGLCSLRH